MSDTVDELLLLHLQKQFLMPGWGAYYERLLRVREGLSPVTTGLRGSHFHRDHRCPGPRVM